MMLMMVGKNDKDIYLGFIFIYPCAEMLRRGQPARSGRSTKANTKYYVNEITFDDFLGEWRGEYDTIYVEEESRAHIPNK